MNNSISSCEESSTHSLAILMYKNVVQILLFRDILDILNFLDILKILYIIDILDIVDILGNIGGSWSILKDLTES